MPLRGRIASVSIYDDTQSDIRVKIIVVCICYKLPFSIWSILIYYRTQSDIRLKIYCRLNLVRASVFNLERLDILWDSIGHPCIKLLLFEFVTIFHFQFRASRYITGLNRTSEYKVIVVWNCSELVFWISSISIYYGNQSNIRVKSYCGMHLLRAFIFNFERPDILPDSIGHPSKKLLSFESSTRLHFHFGASRYITGLIRDSIGHSS